MCKKRVLTGDRPTGRLHLGHYVGSLASRIELQGTHDQFILIADQQALTDHSGSHLLKERVLGVLVDYLSVGIDQEKSTIFVQSMVPALSELALYYLNFVTWSRLKHNPTVKQELLHRGFKDGVPAGFMVYPVCQAADITAFKATIVPVGEDQRPIIEQTNEIVRAFNSYYKCDALCQVHALVSKYGKLPGIDGKNKMSKSLGNAIYLNDTCDQVSGKVKKMLSDPNKVSIDAPGRTDSHPVFRYLDAFCHDVGRLNELKMRYERGGIGERVVKEFLTDVLVEFLGPIAERRREIISRGEGYLIDILSRGACRARDVAERTLCEVKCVMGLGYWSS